MSSGAGSTERALRVAVDATPLLGHPTGIGAYTHGILGSLARLPTIVPSGYAVSWRRRQLLGDLLPPGVVRVTRAMPARPMHYLWRRSGVPPLEWFVGPVDVVHGTNYVVPPTRRAARVVTVHDLTTVRYPELCDAPTLVFPRLVARAIAEGAYVHAPSTTMAAEIIDAFGADPDRVRAIHLAYPPLAEPDPPAVAKVLPAGVARYVLAVGTAEPRKDLPGLVAAFDQLADDHPDVALVLAGPDGWGTAALLAAIEKSHCADRIVRTGWLPGPTVSALFSGAAVLAYPSVYEGFGIPPLQAMAAGVPVVATRAGAVPEVSADGALLVDVGDVDALSAMLVRALDDEDLRKETIARGYARAALFSWTRCAEGLAVLYADAARDAGR